MEKDKNRRLSGLFPFFDALDKKSYETIMAGSGYSAAEAGDTLMEEGKNMPGAVVRAFGKHSYIQAFRNRQGSDAVPDQGRGDMRAGRFLYPGRHDVSHHRRGGTENGIIHHSPSYIYGSVRCFQGAAALHIPAERKTAGQCVPSAGERCVRADRQTPCGVSV